MNRLSILTAHQKHRSRAVGGACHADDFRGSHNPNTRVCDVYKSNFSSARQSLKADSAKCRESRKTGRYDICCFPDTNCGRDCGMPKCDFNHVIM